MGWEMGNERWEIWKIKENIRQAAADSRFNWLILILILYLLSLLSDTPPKVQGISNRIDSKNAFITS